MLFQTYLLSSFETFQTKFIRVGNEIYLVDPNTPSLLHGQLAKKDKLTDRLKDLKTQNPDILDAGMFFLDHKILRIGGSSSALNLPLTGQGRKNTIQVLKKLLPSYSIKELAEE